MTEIELKYSKQLIEIFKHNYNTDIAFYDISFLYRALNERSAACNLNNTQDYLAHISSNLIESKTYLNALKISYSEFFRHGLTFEVLSTIIFPQIIQSNHNNNSVEIRIWSMACASGQEPYSLAILLKELSNNYAEKINFRIFATDNNTLQLEKAKLGIFSASELKNVNLSRQNKWFIKSDEKYIIANEIKEHIEFTEFDLHDNKCVCPPSSIFGGFDLIFCANVLFYLNSESQNSIFEKINHCVNKNAFVATGDCERDIFINKHFQEVYPPSGIFIIKN